VALAAPTLANSTNRRCSCASCGAPGPPAPPGRARR
jgi:hypothetical protein